MIKRQLFLSSALWALTKEESDLVKSVLHELSKSIRGVRLITCVYRDFKSIDATCPTKSSSEECNKNWAVEKYWKYMSSDIRNANKTYTIFLLN